MPREAFQLSMNPLKSSGQFSTAGLAWFAALINFEGLPEARSDVQANLLLLENRCEHVLRESSLLYSINFDEPTSVDAAWELLRETHQDSKEWWALLTVVYLQILKEAVEVADLNMVIWAIGCAERCRAMLVFKESLQEPLLMAQAARRIIDILAIWESNSSNSLEAFWQSTFRDHAYALSQAFSVPMILIGEGTYVGGMTVDRKNAKFADFLYSHESSKEAMLIEIKTPATTLLGNKYRGTYQPSKELNGAVMQALDYRRSLAVDHGHSVTVGTEYKLEAFSPRCMVLIGNGEDLDSDKKRTAFEMYRANLRDVEVVTYDELFRKLETLASVFGLKRGR